MTPYQRILQTTHTGYKCIFLCETGCLWNIKPIVCQMFLCENAEKKVLNRYPDLKRVWNELKRKKKKFTWPDQPVLFDELERLFIVAEYSSPLMYFHNSPGLLKIKQLNTKPG